MSLASEALGFGAMWRTGAYARDPAVIAALGGGPGDEIIGFLYVGTREGPSKNIPEEDLNKFVSYL
jgi:nitroreductase